MYKRQILHFLEAFYWVFTLAAPLQFVAASCKNLSPIRRTFPADMQQCRGFDHSNQVFVQMHKTLHPEAFVTVVYQHVAALVAVHTDRSVLARVDWNLTFRTSRKTHIQYWCLTYTATTPLFLSKLQLQKSSNVCISLWNCTGKVTLHCIP